MALDLNKTALTHRVTATAAAWLDAIGCKPVETEVAVAPRWVADLASYWYPTWTETKRLSLPKLIQGMLGDQIKPLNPGRMFHAIGHGPFSVLVEIKTTRADFQKDRHKWECLNPPAHFCLLAFAGDVLGRDDVAPGWYGLEISANGQELRKVHRLGEVHAQHPGILVDFVAAVGIRRDHRTRYRATRDWLQAYRAKDQEDKIRYSAARLLDGLARWLEGRGYRPERTLRELLPELGIRKPPNYLAESLTYLESIHTQNGQSK